MKGVWRGLAEVAGFHWRWFVVVVPVTVFTVWVMVAGAPRLDVTAMVGPHVAVIGVLSPGWQLGLLLGAIAMLCAHAVYFADDHIVLGVAAYFALLVLELVVAGMGLVATQTGGDPTVLWIAIVGQITSSATTLRIGVLFLLG